MESARPARPEDLPRCRQLAAEALDGIRSARGGPELLAVRAGRPAALVEGWAAAGGDRHLLVGLIDREVVGLAAGRIAPQAAPGDGAPGTPAHPAPAGGSPAVGSIECCYVEPAARQVGVGTALVTGLLSWFIECGCTGVDAWALPGDRMTKQLFEAAGLTARLLVLHRRLP